LNYNIGTCLGRAPFSFCSEENQTIGNWRRKVVAQRRQVRVEGAAGLIHLVGAMFNNAVAAHMQANI